MKGRRKILFRIPSVISQEVKLISIAQEDKVNILKEVGKFLIDISKLIIGGAVITTAIDITSDKLLLIGIAISCAIIIGLGGFYVIIINNRKL